MDSKEIKELLSVCDREPIHIPGAVQAFGALVVCDSKNLEILQASDNVPEFLGAQAVPGKSIDSLFPVPAAALMSSEPATFETGKALVSTHVRDGLRLFELEALPTSDAADLSRQLRAAMEKIQRTETLSDLLQMAAEQLHHLTNFDRVMIYKFHDDAHGEVVAEALNPGVDAYLGLHYPASDIPAPARKMFLENWVRMIPDVNAAPRPLQPTHNPSTGRPLDLGTSLIRSVSPIHLEYLRNMGVGASLTISILSNGKLWGLMACHHLEPKFLDANWRWCCEAIGRLLSSLLRDVALAQEQLHRTRLSEIHRAILARLEKAPDLAIALSQSSPTLLDLTDSAGSAAALYLDGNWVTLGNTPEPAQLNSIVSWLIEHHPTKTVYETNQLSKEFPKAAAFTDVGSGLLAISVPKSARNYILMFRPEVQKTVRWAGNPNKATQELDGRMHPRKSFEEWKENTRGQSKPWQTWEVDAAEALRTGILGIDLRVQFEKEQKARGEAERAVVAREELMAVLSHDLKNPLSSILLSSKLMERTLRDVAAKQALSGLARITRAAGNMKNLIDDILHVTKLESGSLELERQPEILHTILEDTLEMLAPLAQAQSLDLKIEHAGADCRSNCDRDRILQVLSNLVGNAIKFTPEGGKIALSLDCHGPDSARISVSDTGPGIPKEHHDFIFDRFWQANQAGRLGTGLGLAISKGIVQAHGGDIWVESEPGAGSKFVFTLPLLAERADHPEV